MISLRFATADDIAVIQKLAIAIWPSTYSAYLSASQIDYMLGKMYNKEELLTQLENGHVFLIATADGIDVGFAGFSKLIAEEQEYKLHKLYVLPRMQGQRVGKLLLNEVIRLVKLQGAQSIQLNVNRNNKAKDFYFTLGFKIKETVDLEIGNGFLMNDYVMELALDS